MPTIFVKAFNGLKPISDPTLVDQGTATTANNVKLTSGAIEPLKGSTVLKPLTKSNPQTIFRYGSSANETEFWLEFTKRTSVMRSPIVNNQFGMLYWSDGDAVRYAPNSLIVSGSSYPGASYILGVPAPQNKIAVAGTAPASVTTSETRTYVYTYVTEFGEEGPPSTASDVATIDSSQPVELTNLSVAPSGDYSVTLKRIYRSSTVGSAASFQFLAEIPVAQTTFTDTTSQAALGEILPSEDWVAPPATLRGLKMMANNVSLGFLENTLYLSEPNLPHAWPHQVAVDHKIVGVGTFGQAAVVLTESYPYVVTAVDPAAATSEKLALPQACVSEDSIVDTGNSVIYASPDGLVQIGSGGIDIVTKNLFTKEKWQEYNPTSIRATIYENRYMAFFTKADGTRGILVFDFSGQGATLTTADINLTVPVTATYHDAKTDTLYMAQGGNIVRYDAGSPINYQWRSKSFRMPYSLNFGFGQVISGTYPMTMKIYADGVLKQTKTVTSGEAFRLPSGFRALDWSFEVSGAGRVTQVCISTSIEELKQV
jgi:hypothetical protein